MTRDKVHSRLVHLAKKPITGMRPSAAFGRRPNLLMWRDATRRIISDWQQNDAVLVFRDLPRRGRSVRFVHWFQRDVHNTSAALCSFCSWGGLPSPPFFLLKRHAESFSLPLLTIGAPQLLAVQTERVAQHEGVASGIDTVRGGEHVLHKKAVGKTPPHAEVGGAPRRPVTSGSQRQKRVCDEHCIPEAIRINGLTQIVRLPDGEQRRVQKQV